MHFIRVEHNCYNLKKEELMLYRWKNVMGLIFTLKEAAIRNFVANHRDSRSLGESETYVHKSVLYCTGIYSKSKTSIYNNLPVRYK